MKLAAINMKIDAMTITPFLPNLVSAICAQYTKAKIRNG
jgi:hypothetical protein